MATYNAKKGEIERSWYVVDAEGKVLGKLATRVADVLRGKHKPIFTPYVDTGDFVVVINAEKVHLTGTKIDNKEYCGGHQGNRTDRFQGESILNRSRLSMLAARESTRLATPV